MSLLGKGAMTMWHQVKPGMAADHDEWHSHEHIPERIGLPGFRRGRRCRSADGESGWFIMYEVDDLAVLSSPAYLARLNDSSAWSCRIIPGLEDMNRTVSTVRCSHGTGVGAFLVTIRFAPEDVADAERFAEHCRQGFVDLTRAKGVVGAHLLEGDRTVRHLRTREKSLREEPDTVSDWIALMEGYDRELLDAACDDWLNNARVAGKLRRDRYQVNHVIAEADL